MPKHDPRTARLLAQRMVDSFFDGLSGPEKLAVIVPPDRNGDKFSPVYSMLSHTFDVFCESLAMPEEQARSYFKEAVQKRLGELREEAMQKSQG
jgi:hypothetical protein